MSLNSSLNTKELLHRTFAFKFVLHQMINATLYAKESKSKVFNKKSIYRHKVTTGAYIALIQIPYAQEALS